jgi:hypothetical protein
MGLSAFCMFDSEVVGTRREPTSGLSLQFLVFGLSLQFLVFSAPRLTLTSRDFVVRDLSSLAIRSTGCGKHISSRSHCLLACRSTKLLLQSAYYPRLIRTYCFIPLYRTTQSTHTPRRTLLPHGLHIRSTSLLTTPT